MITALPDITRIIFDLDSTLFDTEFFKEKMYEILTIHGYTHDEAVAVYLSARDDGNTNVMSMPGYIARIKEKLAEDGIAFKAHQTTKILNEIEAHPGQLPGVDALLSFCNKHDFAKKLLSLGVPEWQKKKVYQAKLNEFFAEDEMIFTVDEKKGKVETVVELAADTDEGEGIILINDKPTEIDNMMQQLPKMITFARREQRDIRYTDDMYTALEEKYPGQIYWSDSLEEITKEFEKLYG